MFVYVIVCSETLKIYVGQHKGSDLGKYLSRKFWNANHRVSDGQSHLYRAMQHHPRESWSIHPLMQFETREDVDYWERHFIRILKTQHPEVGYNICAGGEGFSGVHSFEARQKMVLNHKKDLNACGRGGKKGGRKAKNLGIGIFAMTPEQRHAAYLKGGYASGIARRRKKI